MYNLYSGNPRSPPKFTGRQPDRTQRQISTISGAWWHYRPDRRCAPPPTTNQKAARQSLRLVGVEKARCARSIHGSAARNNPRCAERPPATGLYWRARGRSGAHSPRAAAAAAAYAALFFWLTTLRRGALHRRRLGSAAIVTLFRWAQPPRLSAGRSAPGGVQFCTAL